MKTGTKLRPGLWLSTLVSLVGLILVVLFSYIIEKSWINNMDPVLLTIVSLIIAFLPPLIWLTVFYRQDRLEPEPKSFVFKTLY
jgi:RsiW-degrading membrane proteinase PrsW (M82 family)